MDEKLSARQVGEWLAMVQEDLRGIEQKLEPLVDQQRRLEEREALLRTLLNSFGSSVPSDDRSPLGVEGAPNGSVAAYVVARASEILRNEGGPLHINDLHARFVERGYAIPGKGRPVNLIVHLRNAQEIASPRRGIYGLVEQVGDVPARRRPTKQKRKRPVRGRS